MKDNFGVDVPVALIFFNRPAVFEKVFDCVRNAKPSMLFLIQDGARSDRPNDEIGVQKCREICNQIDWECKVYKDFSDVNLGCGKRVFTGITNAFKIVDRLVIIEDDITFSSSFLPFCSDLLERYKDDQRIWQISGMNHFGVYEDCNKDYFFSRGGAIWGWATWKRVWDEIDWNLSPCEDSYINKTLLRNGYQRKYGELLTSKSKYVRDMIKSGKSPSFWSFHVLYYSYIQNRLVLVPKYNLTSNIGLDVEATHTTGSLNTMTKDTQSLFYVPVFDYNFPLNHPKYVLDDRYYKEIQDELMYPTGLNKFKSIIEVKIRALIYGDYFWNKNNKKSN